ncbi:nucleic acid-binding, OB-fold protein [Tanacetum coccineum]
MKPYQQTLQNKMSLKFGKITKIDILAWKESEFPENHFECVPYNPLASMVPYKDENSKMIYPLLTDYLGCLRYISEATPFGDSKAEQKYLRKVDIENIDKRFLISNNSKSKHPQTSLPSAPGIRFIGEATVTRVEEDRGWNYASCRQRNKASTQLSGTYTCEDHGKQEPTTYRYNFKDIVADGTATAQFTFFTNLGEKITGHPCSELAQKYKATNQQQLPIELVNIIGKKHIFQFHFTPSMQKGAGKFIVDDILDIQKVVETQHIGTMLATSSFATTGESTGKSIDLPGVAMSTSSSIPGNDSNKKDKGITGYTYNTIRTLLTQDKHTTHEDSKFHVSFKLLYENVFLPSS